jgi:hypothetical protein
MKMRFLPLIIMILLLSANALHAEVMKILVQREIDDDHIIIVTAKGDQLLLKKWTMKLSPLLFEGEIFVADVSSMWVKFYIEGKGEIKWSVEKHLGIIDLGQKNNGEEPPKENKHEQEGYPIEVAHNDELFIINGEKFEAQTFCLGWEQGEYVIFLEGSAYGACATAKLLNLDRNEVCEVWCE